MDDTQTIQTEDEIVSAWAEAEQAPEPDKTLPKGAIKDAGLPDGVGMTIASLESAGWVYVYHQGTGDRSRINRNMLGSQLRKKLEDGSRAFDLKPPVDSDGNIIKPRKGTIKCMLHQSDANRDLYDRWGFPTCPCDNLRSEHDKIQHMKYRHHREWETIERDRQDAEKKEDRAFQQTLYTRLAGALPETNEKVEEPKDITQPLEEIGTQEAPLYVSDKPAKPKAKRKKRKTNKKP